jgi:hypothetical protein
MVSGGGFGHFGWHSFHSLEVVARQRVADARRKADRGARNMRLGLHHKPEPKPNIFKRVWRKLRREEYAGSHRRA